MASVLLQPVLMTFPKVSGGGRACKAGSRGQGEMLQQIYNLWGGTGEAVRGERGEALPRGERES